MDSSFAGSKTAVSALVRVTIAGPPAPCVEDAASAFKRAKWLRLGAESLAESLADFGTDLAATPLVTVNAGRDATLRLDRDHMAVGRGVRLGVHGQAGADARCVSAVPVELGAEDYLHEALRHIEGQFIEPGKVDGHAGRLANGLLLSHGRAEPNRLRMRERDHFHRPHLGECV